MTYEQFKNTKHGDKVLITGMWKRTDCMVSWVTPMHHTINTIGIVIPNSNTPVDCLAVRIDLTLIPFEHRATTQIFYYYHYSILELPENWDDGTSI